MQSGHGWAPPADVEALVTCVSAIRALLKEHPELARTPEAAAALAAGTAIDAPKNSATSKSMMIGRFLESLELLRAMSSSSVESTPLDEIRSRRDRKLGRAGATDRVDAAGEVSSRSGGSP